MTIRQGKILIVDDNEDILFTLKMLLRPRVESITTCSDPKEINRLVSRNQYDVILLDMNFTTDAVSGKEGFYWLERILEIAPDTGRYPDHRLLGHRKSRTCHQSRCNRLYS